MTEKQVNDAMGEVLEEQRTEMHEKFGETPEITEGYQQAASGLYLPIDKNNDSPVHAHLAEVWDPDVPQDPEGFNQWVADELDKLFEKPSGTARPATTEELQEYFGVDSPEDLEIDWSGVRQFEIK